MTCTRARNALLTASRAELRGEGSGWVASHVRDCDACRAVAVSIEAQTRQLAELTMARAQLVGAPTIAIAQRSRMRIAGYTLMPLAAAVAGILVFRETAAEPLQSGPSVTTASGVTVDCKPGQTATVIPTTNPKITIIWLSEGESE